MIILVAETDIGMIIWGGALVFPVGADRIVPRISRMPVAGMEHGAVLCVPVNPAGAAAIVPRIKVMPAAGMEHGMVI